MRIVPRAFARTAPLAATLAVSLCATGYASAADAWDPTVTAAFDITDYAIGLGQVTDFRWLPDGRMIIIEKGGATRTRLTDGTLVYAASFNVNTLSEQGLLGVEVDPAFATNKRLYFYYSANAAIGGTDDDRHRVVSMEMKPDNTLDYTTEKILVRGLRGPMNHDGGSLTLGPDGNLYIGVGDTGCNSNAAPTPPYTPTNFFGTCLSNGNGKILRVALDGSIPSENPLVGTSAVSACGTGAACGAESTDPASVSNTAPRTDIYAWGFRNPWRTWFDPLTGNLWVGDVGEVTIEEIDIVEKGKHYGWPWREGAFGWPNGKCQEIVPNVGDCVDPIYSCQHGTDGAYLPDGDCTCIAGGLIIDSCNWPSPWRGLYYFGDCANGRIWSLQPTPARDGIVKGSRKQLGQLDGSVAVTFRGGPDGALYIAALPGRIIRLAPKSTATCPPADSGVDATPPADAGPKPDGSLLTDSSTNDDGGTSGDTGGSGGCGCSMAGAEDAFACALAIAAVASAALIRRRRR
jgi:glucose/arabinose dehydrogenase